MEEDGVVVDGGNIRLNIHVPFDTILAGEKIKINILGVKKFHLDLNPKQKAGEEYEVKEMGLDSSFSAFVKVFPDMPEKDISTEDRARLVALLQEIYGHPKTNVKPSAAAVNNG